MAEQPPLADPADAAGPPVGATPQIVIQQGRSHPLLRIFAFLGWMAFAFCGMLLIGQFIALSDYFDTSGGMYEKHHSGSSFASNKIAVITVSGVIMEGEGFVKRQIDRVRKDDNVKAVVLRIESPGGTVTGSDYILHHLNKLRDEKKIPLVVSMGSVATSGGYYVAMAVGDQEKCIYAEPTTTTGSIGVIIPHYDLSGLLARYDVKEDSIASGPRKQMLSMTKPIPEDHRRLLEGYVEESFARFKEIVKSGRPEFREAPARLDELATGEIFTAPRARETGLIDEIGFIEDAIERAAELAGLDKDEARVVRFQRQVGLFDLSSLAMARRHDNSELATLLDLTAPRAYYLSTSLPPLIASYRLLLPEQ